MTPTVRRHPRTLAEAWQRPPASFWITGPYRRRRGRAWRIAGWVLGVALLGFGVWIQRML